MSRPHSMETSALLRVVLESGEALRPLLLADTSYTFVRKRAASVDPILV